MAYTLRDANTQDAEEAEWLYQLNKGSYETVVKRQFGAWDEAFQRNTFEDSWRNRTTARIVETEGRGIGVFVLEVRDHELWLQEIQLVSEYQNQGIGSALIAGALRQARTQSKPLRLQVLFENHDAQRLYKRLGFKKIGQTEHHFQMEVW